MHFLEISSDNRIYPNRKGASRLYKKLFSKKESHKKNPNKAKGKVRKTVGFLKRKENRRFSDLKRA